MFYIVEEVERRGMPTELALLPFVESAFQPEAVSSAKAAGLWQFIPSTGRDYALAQTVWKDERRSVIDSTRAALDYLQKLYDMFGDWHLALAAYNWGEGSVARAIEKNRRAGRSTAYTSLKMPLETQHYVPKLQAVKNIVAEPERYGIELPPLANSPYFVAVQRTRDIDVGTAARLAEMTPEEFSALNSQFNRPVIVGANSPTLLLPADRVDTFNANLAAWEATGQPLASWTTYRMQPADTLATVAKRVGISEAQLREANRVPPRYKLAPGSTILIPRDETMDDITAENARRPLRAGARSFEPAQGDLPRAARRHVAFGRAPLQRQRARRHPLEQPHRPRALRRSAPRTHRRGCETALYCEERQAGGHTGRSAQIVRHATGREGAVQGDKDRCLARQGRRGHALIAAAAARGHLYCTPGCQSRCCARATVHCTEPIPWDFFPASGC